MSQAEKPTVLLIEADGSLRRIIALGLQHRGMRVIEASSPATVPALSVYPLHLLILDVDNGIHSNWSVLEEARVHPELATLPIVALAWEDAIEESRSIATATTTQVCYLTKPFDARILYTAVEQLLAASPSPEASTEALLLASYKAQTSPSVWPMITAVGLLLAFIGLLLQFAITIVGILIVMAGLLLWTLGGRTERGAVAVV